MRDVDSDSVELIASICLGDRVIFRLHADGSIHIHNEAPVVGRGVGLSLEQWKRLTWLLNSIDGAGLRKIAGGYNRELGLALKNLNASLEDESGQ